jgi:hypothetical protein
LEREREREKRTDASFFIVADMDTMSEYLRYHINSTAGTNYNVALTEIHPSLLTTSVEPRILMQEHNYRKQEMSKMPLYYWIGML